MEAMEEYDPSFKLPADFFEGEIIGVPTAEQEITKTPDEKPVPFSRVVPRLWKQLLQKAASFGSSWKRRAL